MIICNLNLPLLTWSLIVAAVVILIVSELINRFTHHNRRAPRHQLIEILSERDEFFVPGDRRRLDQYDDDDTY